MEYFIKRIAEIEQQTGLRLLDVLDFHFYPGSDLNGTLQLYRVFYDTSYNYPGAKGVYNVVNGGGYNTSIKQEYIFKRATDWLNQYMGANNGVTMGLSEFGAIYNSDPNVVAVSYASILGTFAENNVEIFAPWDWNVGQWEVLHLFTHYTGSMAVSSTSSQNDLVSAYSSVDAGKNWLSVVLVNRDVTNSQSVNISPENVTIPVETVSCYQLSNLPSTETFVSATNNALKQSSATVSNNSVALTLPKLSVTVVRIPLKAGLGIREIEGTKFRLYPNPAQGQVMIEAPGLIGKTKITISDITGKMIKTVQAGNSDLMKIPVDISGLGKGIYFVKLYCNNKNYSQKLIVE